MISLVIPVTILDVPSDPDEAGRGPVIDRLEARFADQVAPRVA